MIDKSEKYLKSIDDTLKDVLKELKIINNKGVVVGKKRIIHNAHIDVNVSDYRMGHKVE